jgi:hypothetical protein
MVRQYVMLWVILSMIFFAVGCTGRKPVAPEEQKQGKNSDDLWKGYGDYKSSGPKYKNMPPLKK